MRTTRLLGLRVLTGIFAEIGQATDLAGDQGGGGGATDTAGGMEGELKELVVVDIEHLQRRTAHRVGGVVDGALVVVFEKLAFLLHPTGGGQRGFELFSHLIPRITYGDVEGCVFFRMGVAAVPYTVAAFAGLKVELAIARIITKLLLPCRSRAYGTNSGKDLGVDERSTELRGGRCHW